MDKTFYKDKILELLEDWENNGEIRRKRRQATVRKIKELKKKHARELTEQDVDYLENLTCKTSNFCGLPKIYKSHIINAAIFAQNSEYMKLPPPPDLK